MSAKEFYKKPPLHVPELPPEIWTTVLRHATRDYEFPFPSELTFESIGTQRFSSAPAAKLQKDIGEVLHSSFNTFQIYIVNRLRSVISYACVRLGMHWPVLFLYEYIVLGRNRVLASLRDGLSRAVLENRQVGWWTERLDVRMRDATKTPKIVFDTLAAILRYLPNLYILAFAVTGDGFSSLSIRLIIRECRRRTIHDPPPHPPSTQPRFMFSDWDSNSNDSITSYESTCQP